MNVKEKISNALVVVAGVVNPVQQKEKELPDIVAGFELVTSDLSRLVDRKSEEIKNNEGQIRLLEAQISGLRNINVDVQNTIQSANTIKENINTLLGRNKAPQQAAAVVTVK